MTPGRSVGEAKGPEVKGPQVEGPGLDPGRISGRAEGGGRGDRRVPVRPVPLWISGHAAHGGWSGHGAFAWPLPGKTSGAGASP